VNVLHDEVRSTSTALEVRSQAEHRIRKAASLARPGWIWAAAVIMNAPSVGGATLLAWFAFTADGPALTAVASVLFGLAAFWALVATADSWQVLRRFVRRFSR
jgi:VIT1/CCC1 family predicted Fe2+/Mn2+ transporter